LVGSNNLASLLSSRQTDGEEVVWQEGFRRFLKI